MGNCCPPVRFQRRTSAVNPKNVTLLLVGLDNAGKTTIAKRLSEEPLDGVLPTVGFSVVTLQEKGCHVTIYDLGGGPQIRDIWPRYYADVHGVIFVTDAADVGRMNECRKALESLLLDSYIAGKPVLLLANKQDVEGALDEIDIVDRLNVERLVNQQKCPTLVELCSARHFSRKMDVGINNGYKWLLRCITKDYPSLNNRVLKDLSTQDEMERIKKVQREERIKKIRQERENGNAVRTELTEVQSLSASTEEKRHQNGVIPMVDITNIPGQIEDAPKFSPKPRESAAYSVSYSCEFFKYEKDDSDIVLIQNMDEARKVKNFLVRPKSSGPRLSGNRSDSTYRKALRRKSHHRSNKTAPSPTVDVILEPVGPLPKVFDPSYHTEVVPFTERNQTLTAEIGKRVGSAGERTILGDSNRQTSKSAPNSRKASANTGKKRTSSSDLSKLGKLPPIRKHRELPGTEMILDVSKLPM